MASVTDDFSRIGISGRRVKNLGQPTIRDFQIKKYPKTDAKILSISPVSVFSVPLRFVYLDNLFLGNPLTNDEPKFAGG
ncbi:hypothetical protein Cylst_5629 [Cylindrospermum stagnale PCC 7417]|uniref:Uncharacterized protein n=1 Tax=Cylindrospermum stagnale PCC 7417 TaxID=56107 RepID=K9X4N8_9NOST|nr:hypothetical protein Cylst_5629 [Cylindrospermum stagnale PCC 7417]